MTSKERIAAAMNLRPPDRIPLMCQMSIGHMLLQLKVSPADFWFDPNVFADGLLNLRSLYGFDGILISLHGHDPHWRRDVQSRRTTNEGEEVLWKNGDVTLCMYNDLPRVFPRSPVRHPEFSSFSPDELPPILDSSRYRKVFILPLMPHTSSTSSQTSSDKPGRIFPSTERLLPPSTTFWTCSDTRKD